MQITRERYHVTEAENLSSILTHGLVPQVGPRSAQLGEPAAVFLFPTREDAETAVGSWLGEAFDDDEALVLLRVLLDDDVAEDAPVEWERVIHVAIPATQIAVLGAL